MKKILLFTGTRADFGLQLPLIRLIKKKYKLELIVCNMHTSIEFGKTLKEINFSDFKKVYIIKNLPTGQNDIDILNSISLGIREMSKKIYKSNPKLAIILGDRYEMLSASVACFFLKVPTLHINGGEITKGSLDDGIRDAITTFSNFHCPPTKRSFERVKNILGENKNLINSGALGAHNAYKSKIKTKNYFKRKYNINFKDKNILITIHPEKNFNYKLKEIKILLKSLSSFNNVNQIFTASNSDAYGKGINKLIKEFCKKNKNSIYIKSFGKDDYLSILKHMSCVVGNSSSGVIEAPILKVPTINLGTRQKGREFSKSIINAPFDTNILSKKIKKTLYLNKNKLNFDSPYLKKNTPQMILNFIRKVMY